MPSDMVDIHAVDYEAELAVIIGRDCRNVTPAQALDYVLAYTCANDVSARDWQKEWGGGQWCRGKSFDTFCPLGPCLATPDEIPDPQNLMVKSWVNGDLRQISSTSQMIWSVAQLVHFFSINVTLKPGMVIITGTPSGTAWSCDAELGGKWHGTDGMVPATGYLKHGDEIVCEVQGIGRLSNPVE